VTDSQTEISFAKIQGRRQTFLVRLQTSLDKVERPPDLGAKFGSRTAWKSRVAPDAWLSFNRSRPSIIGAIGSGRPSRSGIGGPLRSGQNFAPNAGAFERQPLQDQH